MINLAENIGNKMNSGELFEFLKEKNYKHINIKRNSTGHLLIEGIINGVEGKFILDTGAGQTVLEEKRKEKFKMVSYESDKTATGTGGSMSIQNSENNHIKIGNFEIKDLNIVLMNLDHINNALKELAAEEVDGVIGADILMDGKAIIDYSNMSLYLQ